MKIAKQVKDITEETTDYKDYKIFRRDHGDGGFYLLHKNDLKNFPIVQADSLRKFKNKLIKFEL